jgi:hypothetical protein
MLGGAATDIRVATRDEGEHMTDHSGDSTTPAVNDDQRALRYLAIVTEVHDEWSQRNEAVRFAPDEHPDGSDYNVETLEVEATSDQLDEFDRMLRARLDAEGLTEFPLT